MLSSFFSGRPLLNVHQRRRLQQQIQMREQAIAVRNISVISILVHSVTYFTSSQVENLQNIPKFVE